MDIDQMKQPGDLRPGDEGRIAPPSSRDTSIRYRTGTKSAQQTARNTTPRIADRIIPMIFKISSTICNIELNVDSLFSTHLFPAKKIRDKISLSRLADTLLRNPADNPKRFLLIPGDADHIRRMIPVIALPEHQVMINRQLSALRHISDHIYILELCVSGL